MHTVHSAVYSQVTTHTDNGKIQCRLLLCKVAIIEQAVSAYTEVLQVYGYDIEHIVYRIRR